MSASTFPSHETQGQIEYANGHLTPEILEQFGLPESGLTMADIINTPELVHPMWDAHLDPIIRENEEEEE